jgi:hypothetical protein
MYVSHSQLLVFDRTVSEPGCEWEERHIKQGFARARATACFRTLIDRGEADITVNSGG